MSLLNQSQRDTFQGIQKKRIVVKMNEQSEGTCYRWWPKQEICFTYFVLSLKQVVRLYLPVNMLQWWPSNVHVSITMAMTWNWKENKVGRHKQTNKQTKKKKAKEGKPSAQKRNVTYININIEASD